MLLYEQYCDHKITPTVLNESKVEYYLKQLPQWHVSSEKNQAPHLLRELSLKNYQQVLDLINKSAEIIIQENHHPEICFGYKSCSFAFFTHSANGITIFDFICAAKIERLISIMVDDE